MSLLGRHKAGRSRPLHDRLFLPLSSSIIKYSERIIDEAFAVRSIQNARITHPFANLNKKALLLQVSEITPVESVANTSLVLHSSYRFPIT